MGNIRINLKDSLHKNLKRRAIDEGIPMKVLLVKALEEYVERNPPLAPPSTEDKAGKERGRLTRNRSNV